MRLKSKLCLVGFLALLLLSTFLFIKGSQASENREVGFAIISQGDISGYGEETYLVVRTEAEWEDVWKKHTVSCLSPTSYPEIDFSGNIVICAFMGRRSTSGYSISIERIWADEERMHVEIAKYGPLENFTVPEIVTYPYVFASLERTELDFIFSVTGEDGTINEYILPEFPTMACMLIAFIALSMVIVVLMHKAQRKPD